MCHNCASLALAPSEYFSSQLSTNLTICIVLPWPQGETLDVMSVRGPHGSSTTTASVVSVRKGSNSKRNRIFVIIAGGELKTVLVYLSFFLDHTALVTVSCGYFKLVCPSCCKGIYPPCPHNPRPLPIQSSSTTLLTNVMDFFIPRTGCIQLHRPQPS